MANKKIKLFEIGNGLKSIKLPEMYYADQENDDTVLFYTAENNIWLRVTVITAKTKDETIENPMYEYVIKKSKEANKEIFFLDNKSYYATNNELDEDGEKLEQYCFEIGFKNHYIFLSVTTLLEYSKSTEFQNILADIPNYISSIEEIFLEKTNIFETQYSDLKNTYERISNILEIKEEEINDYHENDKTPILLQKILDENKYSAKNTFELQSLGLAFGDYLQHKYSDFQWVIIRDEYGRDLALKYKKYAINIFPMTMISKRIEDGTQIDINYLAAETIKIINEMVESGDYKEID